MIPPGGEGEIKVTLRPKGRHTEITKNIVVHSNDPDQPRFTLTMKGTLLVDVMAQPNAVNIRDLAPGKPGTDTFSLQHSEGSTAEILSVEVEDEDNFSLREIETEPEAIATYEVRFKGRKELGVSSTRVVVKTSGENTPELTIPVRASVALNLRYAKQFRFTRRDGKLLDRTIRISSRRGDAPKISKVEDPDGLLDIEVLEAQGPMASIRMRVLEDQLVAIDVGTPHTLIVHTNDRDEPKIELEYRIMAERPAGGAGTPATSAPQR